MKHTLTPWRAEKWTSHAPRTVLIDDPAVLAGKRVVAECERDEDAAFIVMACNVHYQLVAALRRIVDEPADGEPWVIASEALAAVGAL
jgi:hypothetical protein